MYLRFLHGTSGMRQEFILFIADSRAYGLPKFCLSSYQLMDKGTVSSFLATVNYAAMNTHIYSKSYDELLHKLSKM